MLFRLIFLLLLCAPLSARQNITSVEIHGLAKTSLSFAQSFISVKPGEKLDSARVEKDAQVLRNLRLFSNVAYRVAATESGVGVEYICAENATLLPLGNFGSIENNFWFQLGAVENNWLGRANTLGATYRYYDRHSFESWLQSPYFFSPRRGLSAFLSLLATIEPTYFPEGATIYDTDRWTSLLFAHFSLSRKYIFEAGGGYLREKYVKNPEQNSPNAPGPDRVEFDKFLSRISFSVSRVDYFSHYLDGLLNESSLETIKTFGASGLFWKIENNLRFYKRFGGTGNFALRLRTGLAANEASPFAPFVLDSYLTVRGAGDRVARGTAEVTLNLEYRQTVLEFGWGALQGVAFTDWSAWRPGGGTLRSLLESQNAVSFFGFGGRLYIKKLNHLILRADYGVGVTGVKQSGVVIGLGQYF